MRYLTLGEVVALPRAVIESTGGSTGVRDLPALESAVAQPRATFDGVDLHPTITGKAAALAYSLALNHRFVDGNQRVAHAALDVFLALNGLELRATIDEQETLFLGLPRAGPPVPTCRLGWSSTRDRQIADSAVQRHRVE
jgi:death-on-curing protein